MAYDALNRVTAKTYPDGGATAVHYGYDLRGLQTFARFDSATGEGVASAYDGFGRQRSSSIDLGGTTRTLAYSYDRDGNRSGMAWPEGTLAVGYSRLVTGENWGHTPLCPPQVCCAQPNRPGRAA